jgi:YVTN family beta-propeller protein
LHVFASVKTFGQYYAYITNDNGNNVSVINTGTNTVTATIPVGTNPIGIVVSKDPTRAYVANMSSNNVSVINTATRTVIATISVGTLPYGIAISRDGSKVYVANIDNVKVINTATNTVSATISIPAGPLAIGLSPNGTKAYVTVQGTNTVAVINTGTNAIVATVPVGNTPFGVAVTPDGTKAYVANQGSNTVSVINTGTNAVSSTVTVGAMPDAFGNFFQSFYNLPVHFTSLTAGELPNSAIQVNWVAANQQDGTQYEIEKSADGARFVKEGSMPGTTAEVSVYSWVDAAPFHGTNYYRIKSVEASGSVQYSKVLQIVPGSRSSKIQLYPNPITENAFTLELANQPKGFYTLTLTNAFGQKVYQTGFSYNGGSLAQRFNVSAELPKGSYQVSITNGVFQNTTKVMIQ